MKEICGSRQALIGPWVDKHQVWFKDEPGSSGVLYHAMTCGHWSLFSLIRLEHHYIGCKNCNREVQIPLTENSRGVEV